MNEPVIPTYILLQRLQNADREERDRIFEILVIRFRDPFEKYARKQLLPEDDIDSVTTDTFMEVYCKPGLYYEQGSRCARECIDREWRGKCTLQFRCVEKAACAFLWRIQQCNIIDCQRKIFGSRQTEQLAETVPAPENSLPETSAVAKCTQEIIWYAWNTLSKSDQQLLVYKPGPGRKKNEVQQVIQQTRREAWERFKKAVRAALAEEY